jgi:caa(3)-type oxidase subunit IV
MANPSHSHDSHLSDTFVIPYTKRKMTLPGGIYTFVFVVLGVLTFVEILIAEVAREWAGFGGVRAFILIVASIAKAVLVVYYYMHLNHDDRVYRWVLLIPVGITIFCALYLLVLPPQSYTALQAAGQAVGTPIP